MDRKGQYTKEEAIAVLKMLGDNMPAPLINKETFNHIYRFHPITKVDAEDIDTTGMSDREKAELAAMRRAGAKFYWQSDTGETYHRCELSNFRFVIEMHGMELVIHESADE